MGSIRIMLYEEEDRAPSLDRRLLEYRTLTLSVISWLRTHTQKENYLITIMYDVYDIFGTMDELEIELN
ncbi:hypothetical protein GW17_00029680 [Ensete ventricosum]|nr:hypothetical protein GW17_00029680 [Ensete ventricosum]